MNASEGTCNRAFRHEAARTEPTVSVVIAAYTDERWNDLVEAVRSVREQARDAEIIVAVDNNAALHHRVIHHLPGVIPVINTGRRGASETRNSGVLHAQGQIVAFLDDDAVAFAGWLEHLLRPFEDAAVMGVGGRLVPIWALAVPRWFPRELGWVIGSNDGLMPDTPVAVRNVWTGNMAVRRYLFDAVGGFRSGCGRTARRSWPEDTDFCLRVSRVRQDGYWLFEPMAKVGHKVPSQRATLSYFLSRFWNEGRNKVEIADLMEDAGVLSVEKAYVLGVLPVAAMRSVQAAILRAEWSGLARAGVIVMSMVTGALGATVGGVRVRLQLKTDHSVQANA